ncbi:SDR family NAD(P)-dependent oxidoreductase [Pannonibacter sp. SL95]|uniref:SDR family NAD(P)-dependent oxidoreductase n=1 Tax=Pannonibacter sp. SL95 TaxID=2995153 RepID=UPI0022768912|nr:SDR family oxidoreductase [Pannonibacter sp. SL95]MCY1707106.1 SDR family oxidoreductase [Pannonibacter sp. SL95]
MRTILVTGASRGLGLAIAARLLQETDTRIAAVARSETDDFRALANAHPDRLVLFRQDLAELDALHGLVREITGAMGPLYGLVNNAAIGLDGLLATQHASDISRVLRLNLESPILLTKYACRSMLTVGTGRIVNVGSIIASTGFSGLSVYGATKAGLEGFTRSLARELGRAKITVNCLAPGYMETDMTAGLTEDKLASVRRRAPLGLPKPEDVAGAVAYLMSPEAAMVTGTVMTVDGGSTA